MPNAVTVLLLFGATPAHGPECPPEPWLKGVHRRRQSGERREATEKLLLVEQAIYMLGVKLQPKANE